MPSLAWSLVPAAAIMPLDKISVPPISGAASSSSTFAPRCAAKMAAGSPAVPAPTTIRSKRVVTFYPVSRGAPSRR